MGGIQTAFLNFKAVTSVCLSLIYTKEGKVFCPFSPFFRDKYLQKIFSNELDFELHLIANNA